MLLYKCGLAICVILILAGTAWVSAGPNANIYFTYSLLALMAFGLELADGSTMGFVFVILALPRLNGTETLLLAGSALFILAVVRRPQPSPKVLLQSLGAIGIAVLVAHGAYHAPVVAELRLAGRLVIASSACFAALHLFGRKRADLWSFPYYLLAAAMAALFPVSVALIPLLYLAWRSYRFYERRLERQCEQSRQAASLNLRTIETLAQAIEAKDQPLSGRSRRVQIYAVRMAQELRLPPLAVEALRTASLLYDIGELAVPEHIILKPGPLTPEEFEKMKTHAAVGAEILERVKFPYPVAPIVLAHHERWDGAGYPHGLKGEE